MKVKILSEYGYNEAMYGFSLSFKDRAIDPIDWLCPVITNGRYEGSVACEEDCNECELQHREKRYHEVLKKHARMDGGHNKFLEHIVVWLDVEAPLELWKQLDTYRVGVSKQSESTMHTLDKRDIVIEDFDLTDEELNKECISDPTDIGNINNPSLGHILGLYLQYLNHMPPRLKSKLLPQAYKQRREIVLNYKVLRHIINQRKNHKLPEWQFFIQEIYRQIEYPELLPEYPYGDK